MDFDLVTEPDIYSPSINTDRNYVDYIPPIHNGLRCPCGKKEHVFLNKSAFLVHIKSKTHQKWLELLNQNKSNYYTENIKLHELVDNQKKIIARLQQEQDLNVKIIYNLTKKLEIKIDPIDLMSFD